MEFNRKWIIENGVPIVQSYNGNITLRGLHYRLVAKGMTNNLQHYKRVVSAMIQARWNGLIDFDDLKDHERETIGNTNYRETTVEDSADTAKQQIRLWATSYKKNRWENQDYYPEIFIEKKALQGVFEAPCRRWDVALNPCKGYPSLTFLYDAVKRFRQAKALGKRPVILYFGDYDCSGEDIPRSIQENMNQMGVLIQLERIALTREQVERWQLPPAPTKSGDSRAANWDGLGQVELDAVEPTQIVELLEQAISGVFDADLHDELVRQEEEETEQFRQILRDDFNSLLG